MWSSSLRSQVALRCTRHWSRAARQASKDTRCVNRRISGGGLRWHLDVLCETASVLLARKLHVVLEVYQHPNVPSHADRRLPQRGRHMPSPESPLWHSVVLENGQWLSSAHSPRPQPPRAAVLGRRTTLMSASLRGSPLRICSSFEPAHVAGTLIRRTPVVAPTGECLWLVPRLCASPTAPFPGPNIVQR